MEVGKLQEIVTRKNERLERDALAEAEFIIEQIANKQQLIANANIDIEGLRQRLKDLEIKQLDSQALLGQ